MAFYKSKEHFKLEHPVIHELIELQKSYQELNKKALSEKNTSYADLYHGSQAGVERAIEIVWKFIEKEQNYKK